MGFEYSVVITLASREFRVLLTILPTCLRFFCAYLASSGSHSVATPPLLPNLTVYSCEAPSGFRLLWRSSGPRLPWQTVTATIPAPILLLALRSAAVVAVFFPSFAIFVLLWGLLFFLGISAFIPRLHFWCCLFCSACLFSSSLSPLVARLVCFSC